MWRALAFNWILLFVVSTGVAEERPQGLLWNRSGLAATLPLQVKSSPGTDYLLHLRDVGSGERVLAAYIRGGEFLRVLVPPGRYDFLFAAASDWQGETDAFGPETHRFALELPLSFDARFGRREGHLIDLRDPERIVVRDFAICQRLALDLDSLGRPEPWVPPPDPLTDELPVLPPDFPVLRFDMQTRVCN